MFFGEIKNEKGKGLMKAPSEESSEEGRESERRLLENRSRVLSSWLLLMETPLE